MNVKQKINNMILKNYWNKRHDFYLPIKAFGCNENVYFRQKQKTFSQKIKFSILVPLYNTPEACLKEMIGSVLFQSYENWELCLADGSDNEHKYVGEICKKISVEDTRIKYQKLPNNKGISENTNACIDMATGDYISLFDHDDLLHPFALYETMKAICEESADFIYTDEAIFQSPELHAITTTNFKPDFAPDYFLGINYLCHFSSFKKSLLMEIGKFDPETDGAQDYDLFLRLTSQAKKIVHIKKCLYYWRATPVSTASGIQSKTYAIDSGKLALEKYFRRCNLPVNIVKNNSILYKAEYKINQNYKVSIIILAEDSKAISQCINSIKQKTVYDNFEILIADYKNLIKNSEYEDIKIIKCKYSKNTASIYSEVVKEASGDYLLFLSDNLVVGNDKWIEELLMYAQRKDVGVVGAKLCTKNNEISNFGYIIGVRGFVGTLGKGFGKAEYGYGFRLVTPQNVNAVSSDCFMISKQKYNDNLGFDINFGKGLFDIDFCLKLRQKGFLHVCTPYAELNYINNKKKKVNKTEEKNLKKKWKDVFDYSDCYYNPSLSTKREDFSITGKIFPEE